MIVEPELRVPDFAKAGADIISVHAEVASTIHLHRSLNQIKDLGCLAGAVLNPGTPLSAIEEVLEVLDLVLIMSVNPGFGGQAFIPSQLDKIRRLKEMCNEKVRDLLLRSCGEHFRREVGHACLVEPCCMGDLVSVSCTPMHAAASPLTPSVTCTARRAACGYDGAQRVSGGCCAAHLPFGPLARGELLFATKRVVLCRELTRGSRSMAVSGQQMRGRSLTPVSMPSSQALPSSVHRATPMRSPVSNRPTWRSILSRRKCGPGTMTCLTEAEWSM